MTLSISDRIAPHIPYLRRYGRALSGSQAAGDAYVIGVLEVLVQTPEAMPTASNDKVALYRLFHTIWSSAQVDGIDVVDLPAGDQKTAYSRLSRLTPRSRLALLLTALEGLTNEEAAEVLETDAAGIVSLVSDAVADIERQTSTRVLIIEDEPIISADLEAIVEDLRHEVVGVARTRTDAVARALRERPGLVLADIQLADGSSGIDAVKDILESFSVPVIFITSFPERLLTGERPEPTFLITKPYQEATVRAAISQALFFNETTELAAE